MGNKLEAYAREDVEVESSDINNYTLTFSAATFELTRWAIYSCLHADVYGHAIVTVEKDQNGDRVQEIIRIKNWSAVAKIN